MSWLNPSDRARGFVRKLGKSFLAFAVVYCGLPLLVFDFATVATPNDEDNFGDQAVAIGPQPWWWVPRRATRYDIRGGWDYSPRDWPCVVWKPLCIAYVRARGYALPGAWRVHNGE